VIDNIEKILPGKVDALKLHQLTIDLAEDLKDRSFVIFVDARVNDSDELIQYTELQPAFKIGVTTHYITPETLLEICKRLHDETPRACLFSIKGFNFDFGEKLSERTKEAADEVVNRIVEMIIDYNG
jgi:hydrogenase maturation protease